MPSLRSRDAAGDHLYVSANRVNEGRWQSVAYNGAAGGVPALPRHGSSG